MEDNFLHNNLVDRFEHMLEQKEQYYFDTEEFYEIIAYYLDIGDLPFAKKALIYAFDMHPDSIDIQIKEVEYFLENNQLKLAEEKIKNLENLGQNDSDFLVCQAKFWSLKKQAKRAIDFYLQALEVSDEQDYIYNCLGNEFLNLNELGKALFYYKKAIEKNLNDDFAFYSCIQCFEKMHLHKEAVKFLEQYIDLNPYSEMGWNELGQTHLTLKNYEKASQAFDYATLINSKSVTAYSQKAFALEKLEQYQAAIDAYKEILTFDDSSAHTHLQIGKCYVKMQKPFKAIQSFHQSIHEDPQLDKAWSETADLYEKIGSYEDANYCIQRALDLDSTNLDYIKRQAYIHIQLGMYEESVQDFQKLIKLEQQNFYNWLGLVELLITIGDYQQAINTVFQAKEKFQRAELYYQLSNCYMLLKQENKAIEALQKATELDANLKPEMLKKYPILNRGINKIDLEK